MFARELSSPVNDLEIRYLIKNALTAAVDDREVYYEGNRY
ncbi:hypothetical protein A5819_001063 [Enterococcus sp. 7E2_DIV0204]|uniref:Uncharacterized protein n=1 Tax=Candidatus Enterococcus lemimoniae TaxID=1834167 RepID=A0ABZ2T7K7_9ENTE|nr:hypothetical protein A5819_001063 [Enterococcus sp. 7E2_DIV0204]OTO70744.1 hypothetical protein A5866_002981 [Enterococcus sp. 12C11_DIV0727]OTP51051.1 hypothetical protein A5884_000237 [Enterococcus sp. 7D2_DIV0200]